VTPVLAGAASIGGCGSPCRCSSPPRTSRCSSLSSAWTCPSRSLAQPGSRARDAGSSRFGYSSESPRCTGSPSPFTATGRSFYLTEERGLGVAAAGLALTTFWVALTAGRFVVAAVVLRKRPAFGPPRPDRAHGGGLPARPAGAIPARAVLAFRPRRLRLLRGLPADPRPRGRRFPAHRAWVSSALFAALVCGLGAGPSRPASCTPGSTSGRSTASRPRARARGLLAVRAAAIVRRRRRDSPGSDRGRLTRLRGGKKPSGLRAGSFREAFLDQAGARGPGAYAHRDGEGQHHRADDEGERR